MSYLGPLRMHFAGRFQAAVSTVNNDPAHFNNATFKPEDQQRGQGATKGWWNPRGDADWRLIDCNVTAAFLADGSPAPSDDPVFAMTIADSDMTAPAKLVDLDPCQQLVSTVWGLEVRVADARGRSVVRGAFTPAAFFDLWGRAQAGGGGDFTMCAYYQSHVTELDWTHDPESPFLKALREACAGGALSMKFMVDGYNMTFGDPDFTLGRIVGTIAPAAASEPTHMVAGRQLAPQFDENGNPVQGINFASAWLGTDRLYLDLGNALPTTTPGGPIADVGALELHAGDLRLPVAYETDAEWYERTAGIVIVPDKPLTSEQQAQLATQPLALWRAAAPNQPALTEVQQYVRPDQIVYRSDPGDDVRIAFVATNLGQPLAGAKLSLTLDNSQLQPPPDVGLPANALTVPAQATTDHRGVAEVVVATRDPGWPRAAYGIDGQVYGIAATIGAATSSPPDTWSFASLLLWSKFTADDPPTWRGSLQPLFQQYANLYPIMQDFLDLSSYEDVCANRELLLLAFGLDRADPNSMPVTRDLSAAKRTAILRWLRDVGEDGKPLLGVSGPQAPGLAGVSAAAATPIVTEGIPPGGKAAAIARRRIAQGKGT